MPRAVGADARLMAKTTRRGSLSLTSSGLLRRRWPAALRCSHVPAIAGQCPAAVTRLTWQAAVGPRGATVRRPASEDRPALRRPLMLFAPPDRRETAEPLRLGGKPRLRSKLFSYCEAPECLGSHDLLGKLMGSRATLTRTDIGLVAFLS